MKHDSTIVETFLFDHIKKVVPEEVAMQYSSLIAMDSNHDKEKALEASVNALHDRFTEFQYKDIDAFIFNAQLELDRIKDEHLELFGEQDEHYLEFINKKYHSEKDLVYEGGIKGYRLDHYWQLQNKIDGIRAGLHIIAADPNVGKTSLMVSMAWDLLESNKDVHVVFYTVDDEKGKITNNMLACISNVSQNKVDRKRSDEDRVKVDDAYNDIIGWSVNRRFSVIDSSVFENANQLNQHMMRTRKEFKDKDLVIMVDGCTNLHMEGQGEERYNKLAMLFKRAWKPTATGLQAIPIIISNELRKRNDKSRPKKSDIKGSSKWEYVADSVICLSAEDEDALNSRTNMTVIADLDKNKFGSGKGITSLLFDPDCSKFIHKT